MQRIFPVILCLLLFVTALFANSVTLDSLKTELSKSEKDEVKCFILITIGDFYKYENPDSAVFYYNKCLELAESSGLKKYSATALIKTGYVYHFQTNYDRAIGYYLRSLKIAEDIENLGIIASCYSSIGSLHFDQLDFDKAIEYSLKSLTLSKKLGDKDLESANYNNIGLAYYEKGNLDKALDYFFKSLVINSETGNNEGLIFSYRHIGVIYRAKGNFAEAEKNLLKSLEIAEKTGDILGVFVAYGSMANLNIVRAESAQDKKVKHVFSQQAVEYAAKAYNFFITLNNLYLENAMALSLKQAYTLLGDCNNALKFSDIYIATKDSLYNEERTRVIADIQTKYETEKKLQEIETQRLVIEKQKIESRRQETVKNFLIAGSGLLSLLVLIILLGYRQKQRSNNIIKEKHNLLEQANEEIRAQKEKVESQHQVVVNHKNFIEEQKKRIDDSILYASHIQSAVLISESQLKALLENHFIIFRPKEVVSGDFYWTAKVNDWIIIAVADCTGHGVPGAFMSILGISLLNEIVRRNEITEPAAILEELRKSLVESLVQNSDADMKREGMNACILSINKKTNEYLWAGARNPIWIIRNDDKNKSITEIKADSTSIALHKNMKVFSCNKMSLNKGDRVYMFSDGIVDQFGGKGGLKFSKSQLKNLLSKTASKSLDEQKQILEKALDNWQNPPEGEKYEQVDDITLVCIKF